MEMTRPVFPVDACESKTVQLVRENQVVVISAPTGSGKTTRIPDMLRRAGFAKRGMIGVTEPRQQATKRPTAFACHLINEAIGETIGYQIRGDRRISQRTKIKYMTEGILLREMHSDPLLRKYSVIFVDEAHEQNIMQETILALMTEVLPQRPDLRLVISSATIASKIYVDHFGAKVIDIPGRMFDVDIRHANQTPDDLDEMIKACIEQVARLLRAGKPGEILAFLPDEVTIRKVCKGLNKLRIPKAEIHALYRNQTPAEQDAALESDGTVPKAIIATNIAETSITFKHLIAVVDTGLIKKSVYINDSMSALRVTEHSQAGCDQRAGRAGRVKDGVCYRLYSKSDYEARMPFTEPEIQCIALDEYFLQLRVLGYTKKRIMEMRFVNRPEDERWEGAETRLQTLGMIDNDGKVTDDGRRAEKLTVPPIYGRMILSSIEYGCLFEVSAIVAGLIAGNVFPRPGRPDLAEKADTAHAQFKVEGSDPLSLLRAWEAWDDQCKDPDVNQKDWAFDNFLSSKALREIDSTSEHILRTLERDGVAINTKPGSPELITKAVAAGLIINLMVKAGKYNYRWQDRTDVFIFPGSAAFTDEWSLPECMVAGEVYESHGPNGTKTYARGCTNIDKAIIVEIVPANALEVTYEVDKGILSIYKTRLMRIVKFGPLELERTEITEITESDDRQGVFIRIAARILQDANRMYGLSDFHPMTADIRTAWREICNIYGISTTLFDEYSKLKVSLRVLMAIANQLVGCRTLEEVQACPISLTADDYISAEDMDAYLERRAAEQARSVAWLAEKRQREAARAAERLARREETQPLRDRLNAMRERLSPFRPQTTSGLRGDINVADSRLREEWYELSRLEPQVAEIERRVTLFEEGNAHLYEMSQTAYDGVMALTSSCPFCGAAWQPIDDEHFACSCQPDERQLIRLSNIRQPANAWIGEFRTNRDDLVAKVILHDGQARLNFYIARDKPWIGKKFSSIEYTVLQAVLPAKLNDARSDIIDELLFIEGAKVELIAEQAAIDEAKAGLAKGLKAQVFTFSLIGGRSACNSGNRVWQAAYEADPYPESGETWLCRLGADSTFGCREVIVYPLLKLETSEDDVQELRDMLAESYPGIPEELLSL